MGGVHNVDKVFGWIYALFDAFFGSVITYLVVFSLYLAITMRTNLKD